MNRTKEATTFNSDVDVESLIAENEELKERIAELEEELKGYKEEVTELKKVTPSTSPVNHQALNRSKTKPLTKWELIAQNLNKINRDKNYLLEK